MEGPFKNSDGLFQYVNSSVPHSGRSTVLTLLIRGALTLTAVVLVSVLLLVFTFGKAMTEEFCESAPGGRGYSGEKSPEEVSAVCAWARRG